MQTYMAKIREVRLDANQEACVWIECQPKAIPRPGRYLMAWSQEYADTPLATPVFASEISQEGFLTAAPIPAYWQPGMSLILTGPCGHGFELPVGIRHLAVASFGDSIARLLPLILDSSVQGRSVAVFANCRLPSLPAEIEINPLDALPTILDWADFLVGELPLEQLNEFKTNLKTLGNERISRIPGQVLVVTDMPCAGVSECGACSILLGKSYQHVCKDGPVFDLRAVLK